MYVLTRLVNEMCVHIFTVYSEYTVDMYMQSAACSVMRRQEMNKKAGNERGNKQVLCFRVKNKNASTSFYIVSHLVLPFNPPPQGKGSILDP